MIYEISVLLFFDIFSTFIITLFAYIEVDPISDGDSLSFKVTIQ